MKDLTKPFGSMMGTSQYYMHPIMQQVLYTDGMKDMCEKLECYWILDVIASYQIKSSSVSSVPYQTWRIEANNAKAIVACYDCPTGNPIVTQNIDSTTLPDGKIVCVCVYDGKTRIIALPIEG